MSNPLVSCNAMFGGRLVATFSTTGAAVTRLKFLRRR